MGEKPTPKEVVQALIQSVGKKQEKFDHEAELEPKSFVEVMMSKSKLQQS